LKHETQLYPKTYSSSRCYQVHI